MTTNNRFLATVLAPMLALALSATLVGSCKSTGEGGTSGVDSTHVMGQLTASEKTTFCDWLNGLQGGYGRTVQCPGGVTAMTDTDRDDCVTSFMACGATVRQVEDCVRRVGGDVCSLEVAEADECRAVSGCF